MVVGIAIASGYLNSRLDKICRLGTMDSSCSFWIDFRNQRWDFHVVHSFHGKIKQMGKLLLVLLIPFLSGTIDYILGNKAAIITYPVTFLIYTFAIKKWEVSQEGRPNQMSQKQLKLAAITISIIAFLFAFVTNYIGYGGKMNLLAYVTTIAFALSLIANALNALKLTTQWGFWLIYNFVQLTKAGIQGNFANIGKYIFYILNAIGALFVWNDEEVEQ